MRTLLRSILPIVAAWLAMTLGASRAEAQCPDFDGDGTPDGTGCESGGRIEVSPPTPVEPPDEPPPPEAPPSEQPPPEQAPPEQSTPTEPVPGPAASDPGAYGPPSASGGGGSQVDPAIAAQRAVEAAEARAAWERAAGNLRALEERGRALDQERRAFRRILDAARRRSGRVAAELVPVPLTGAAPTAPPRAWQGSPPPALGRRLAGPPPPPLGADRFVPVSGPWPEPVPIAGLFDPQELLRAARDRILDETKQWLTGQARDVIERNVPGVRRLREVYETLQQYAQIGRDLSTENEATIEGVFRAAGEVQRCMVGTPCDAAFVDSLVQERVEAHRSTARDWIRELTGEQDGDEGDDGDGDEEGDAP